MIKTRNKPGKKIILYTSHSAVTSSLGKDLGTQNWISIFAWSPKVNSEPLIYIFHRVHRHGSYNFRQTNFKDFSSLFQRQITVSRTKIFLTLFWTHYWLKHIMESFTTLTSSAMVHHIILYYFPRKTLQNDWWKKLLRVSRLTSYKQADVRKNTETRVLLYEGPLASPSSDLW